MDVAQGQESIGYFQGAFEQMQTLGLLEEAEVGRMLGRLSAQQQLLDECRAVISSPGFEPQKFDPLGADTLALVSDNIASAQKVLEGRQKLDNEILHVRSEPNIRMQGVPLLGQITPNINAWSRNLPFKWNNVGFQLLSQSGVVLTTASLCLLRSFQYGENIHMVNREVDSIAELASVEITLATIYDPRNRVHREGLPAPTLTMFEQTYGEWQTAVKTFPDGVPAITDHDIAVVSQAHNREIGERAETLGVELAQLVPTHRAQTETFRPSWSMLEKKAGLRPFYNKLLHVSRSETGALAIPSQQDAKRITGMLYVLERLGSKPEQLAAKMSKPLADEKATDTSIRRVKAELTALGMNPTATWYPLQDDLQFIKQNWSVLQGIVRDAWKPSVQQHATAAAALTAMSRALDFALQYAEDAAAETPAS